MARGGSRIGSGRPKDRKKDDPPACSPVNSGLTPLEHMLAIMNDANADPLLRARMAVAAAPFVHAKSPDPGKKDGKNRAAREVAQSGKFSTPSAPKLVSSR